MYFVRHGQSIANVERIISNAISDHAPLTELGRVQAIDLLEVLRKRGEFGAIYTSPLQRARETAQIIATGLGLEVEIKDGLREPFCGEIEGRGDYVAWELHAKQEKEWSQGNHDFRIPGGESRNDVENRFILVIEDLLLKLHEMPADVIVVSHGSILINMLPQILTNIQPDFARKKPFGNCSIVVAMHSEDGLRCTEWCGVPLE